MSSITVVGGGFAGLTAAISCAEAGTEVTLFEAHARLGGRGRTTGAPYAANEGPHVFYAKGPHWPWLVERGLTGRVRAVPPAEGARFRFVRGGRARALPPAALLRALAARGREAPVDEDFAGWAARALGPAAARAAAAYLGVATFDHDPGRLSAAFAWRVFCRASALPPEARYVSGGWGAVMERMGELARRLGVRIETGHRVAELPAPPVIVATSPAAAGRLLGADLAWESGRTMLLDVGTRARRGDAFIVSDLDAPGWAERFSAVDPSLAPAGHSLTQVQVPLRPGEDRAAGLARAERLLDLGMPGWRERETWRRSSVAAGRTGALELPGLSWRDRPRIDRGGGVFLAGDQTAAPGVLSEVSFTSARRAAELALRAVRPGVRGRSHGGGPARSG
ncbi:FAD-dependent oxidoreductase [Allonocardiopsis opalescens]|uniref:Phytoene dehydrogenase-like protein n=1 Tax=Allonocardiopsis opalescens TaxID=1144618 RepID=A0A2T0Q718_9ACTN|nr:FAD-dependent oxidoreductase [Allonocardiopsis opalescens]PRX99619.1 phytoene dehydrogenase-like protein [Allonocardiopsis opalescens]